GDGVGDACDIEVQCDGLDDDGDGAVDEDFADDDGDAVANCVDVCVDIADPGQADTDGDGVGDACDIEVQCDGLDDDGDGAVDEDFPDGDGDTVANCVDVCVDVSDPGQADTDGDGVGDACDIEVQCDGLDDDGDGAVDEDFADDDGDTVANCVDVCIYVADPGQADADGDGVGDACEGETCNSIDDDGDGAVDEDLPTVRYYVDADGDGDGSASATLDSCFPPTTGWATTSTDCADDDASRAGTLDEACDGADTDCDGTIDETFALLTWYADADTDGYGDPNVTYQACAQPLASVNRAGDCDDARAYINPGEVEVCDPLDEDEDCSGAADNDDTNATGLQAVYEDGDGDSYGVGGEIWVCDPGALQATRLGDCDDTDALVNPLAAEVCDGLDNDCDGSIDPVTSVDAVDWFKDGDGDGYGDPDSPTTACDAPEGYLEDFSDCDDSDATIYPGAEDAPYDGIDQDCSGGVDDDLDGDGYGIDEDCDDEDASRHPGATDVIGDGIDQNCSGGDAESFVGSGASCSTSGGTGGGFASLAMVFLFRRSRRRDSSPS
ncbi:MAG: putative metal-binding motif-containing protein, partial [Proteobacteria bacterium]|nr:putative metal-binding motif-containing protein [Pseudomonadota bacterium]